MASNKGHDYEVNAARALKRFGLMPRNFKPAGSKNNRPDIELWYDGKREGVELKTKGTSAGGMVLKYDGTKNQPWIFSLSGEGDADEKEFMVALAKNQGIVKVLKTYWKEVPYLRENKDATWYKTAGKMTILERYARDKAAFEDLLVSVPATAIEDYYVAKHSHYINIGIYGFYLLGKGNPLKLEGVPRFADVARAEFRIRIQKKKVTGQYQFLCEFQFSIKAKDKSPFNIAPINTLTVEIIPEKIRLGCFDKLKDSTKL